MAKGTFKKFLYKASQWALIALAFALLCLFAFYRLPAFGARFVLSCRLFVLRFAAFFGADVAQIRVLPVVSGWSLSSGLSVDWGRIGSGFVCWGWLLLRRFYYVSMLGWAGDRLFALWRFLFIFIALFFCVLVWSRLLLKPRDSNWADKSFSAKAHEGALRRVWRPFRGWLLGCFDLLRGSWLRWAFYSFAFAVLGGLSLGLDLFSGYFYFMKAWDFVGFFDHLAAIVWLILYDLNSVPLWLLVIGVLLFLRWLDKRAADKRIAALFEYDVQLVSDEHGLFTLLLGVMRSGKTYLVTAFSLCREIVFRRKALANMDQSMSQFPRFPWVGFYHYLDDAWKAREAVNVEQLKKLSDDLFDAGSSAPDHRILGYDLSKERTVYFKSAYPVELKEAMALFAQSYFMYGVPDSLIAGDYAIVDDAVLIDRGHFPMWDTALTRHDWNKGQDVYITHIANLDTLHFGLKVHPEDHAEDYGGPSIYAMSEFGKEVGQKDSNSGYDVSDTVSNPKNCLLDYSVKMGGHWAEIGHCSFFCLYGDEQRSGSLAANLVDLAQEVVSLNPRLYQERSALRLWIYSPIVLNWLYKKTQDLIHRYSFAREDVTLFSRFVFWLNGYCYGVLDRNLSKYGYRVMPLPNCHSDSTGNLVDEDPVDFMDVYCVFHAEHYRSGFLANFLNKTKLQAKKGFHDLPRFGDLDPSAAEFEEMNSFLIRDLNHPELKFQKSKRDRGAGGSADAH